MAIGVNEQVLRLEVTIYNPKVMHEIERRGYLTDVLPETQYVTGIESMERADLVRGRENFPSCFKW